VPLLPGEPDLIDWNFAREKESIHFDPALQIDEDTFEVTYYYEMSWVERQWRALMSKLGREEPLSTAPLRYPNPRL
jgi:hypothetical protein